MDNAPSGFQQKMTLFLLAYLIPLTLNPVNDKALVLNQRYTNNGRLGHCLSGQDARPFYLEMYNCRLLFLLANCRYNQVSHFCSANRFRFIYRDIPCTVAGI